MVRQAHHERLTAHPEPVLRQAQDERLTAHPEPILRQAQDERLTAHPEPVLRQAQDERLTAHPEPVEGPRVPSSPRPPLILSLSKDPPSLLAVLAAFLLLGAVYSLANPLFEAPDEFWHYGYVRHLALTGQLPVETPTRAIAHGEASQPPLSYAAAALLVRWVEGLDDTRPYFQPNPASRIGDLAAGPGERNAVLRAGPDAGCGPDCLAAHLARLVSLLFGAGTVLGTFALGREVFGPGERWPLLAAATAAAVPQFLYVSSAASNDAAIACCATAALVYLLRLHRGPAEPRTVLALGTWCGLALLAKASGLLLLGLAVPLALVVPLRRTPTQDSGLSTQHSTVPLALVVPLRRTLRGPLGSLAALGLLLVPVALLAGWWLVRNVALFGDPTGIRLMLSIQGPRAVPVGPLELLVGEGLGLWQSYWAVFGWSTVPAPAWTYLVFATLTLSALAGLVRRAIPGLLIRDRTAPRPAAGQLGLLVLWAVLVLAAVVRWSMLTPASFGRLLFPAHGALAVLLVAGWSALPGCSGEPPSRARRLAAWAPTIVLAAIALALPATIIAAYWDSN
ncbi:MAG: glycosyltransferase family 39 protein [Chloroflexi bacterium]|nr:glycosyltransferase family 39 protein [Chloroflexota bacterium]